MKAQQINQEIMFGNFTDAELTSFINSIKFARAQLVRQARISLMEGDTVSFHSTKRGRTIQGVITKIAQKYATVRTADGNWKVPMNMLSEVSVDKALA